MKIVIVGGGIIGLTTGLYLKKTCKDLDDVTIVTDKITPNTTADGAAGIWGIYLLTDTPIEQQKYFFREMIFTKIFVKLISRKNECPLLIHQFNQLYLFNFLCFSGDGQKKLMISSNPYGKRKMVA